MVHCTQHDLCFEINPLIIFYVVIGVEIVAVVVSIVNDLCVLQEMRRDRKI